MPPHCPSGSHRQLAQHLVHRTAPFGDGRQVCNKQDVVGIFGAVSGIRLFTRTAVQEQQDRWMSAQECVSTLRLSVHLQKLIIVLS